MSQSTIKLNLVNNSKDAGKSEYVVFQKNVAENFGELAIAWRTIVNLGLDSHHPFNYPLQFDVSAQDSDGNFTKQLPSDDGASWEVVEKDSGHVLQPSSLKVGSPTETEVHNRLTKGAISANIYRDGKLLAAKTGVSPDEKAVFEFKPKIWIGAASEVEEGQVMNSAILQTLNTELDLTGLESADIVITGGGTGADATAFEFVLANKKEA